MYNKMQAKNGLNVIVSPMKHMSSVSLGIWIGVGGRYESKQESGISHLVEHMLFKGTNTRTTKELKQAVEGVGGAFNGFTSDEVTCYMVKVPARYMELGVDVLADMVLDAKIDQNDLAREKFVIYEEIKMYRDQPADHVLDVLGELMWPGDALGRPLTGNINTVKGINRDSLLSFKEKNYHPGNISVIAAGNVDPKKIASYAAEKFAHKKKSKRPSFRSPRFTQKEARVKIISGTSSQAHIAIGFLDKSKNIRQRYAMKLMNVIFGGNMSSRLFEELREKHGLCYDIASSYKRHSDIGEVQIHAGVDNRKAARSVVAILDEIKKIRDTGITDDELERAKKYTKGQFLLAMEATSTRMLWLGDRFMVHRNIPEVKDVLRRIDSVTKKEITSISQEVFTAPSANLAMISKIGEREKNKIRKELIKL